MSLFPDIDDAVTVLRRDRLAAPHLAGASFSDDYLAGQLLAVTCLVVGLAIAWWGGHILATQLNAIIYAVNQVKDGQEPLTLHTSGATSELDRVALAFNQLAMKQKKR